MRILERWVQNIRDGQWQNLEDMNRELSQVEDRYGFAPKRRYRRITGSISDNTLVVEREWASMADMEAAYDAIWRDPDYARVTAQLPSIIAQNEFEIYQALPSEAS